MQGHEIEIKPIPAWLNTVVPTGAWVTLAPFIFHPEGVKPEDHPAIMAHELTHIQQQTESDSVIRWVDRYFTDKEFRLQMEIEAIRNELPHIPLKDLAARIYGWGNMLAFSGPYMKAADSPEQVVDLLKDLYPGILPPPFGAKVTQESFSNMEKLFTHGVDLKDKPVKTYGNYGAIDVDWWDNGTIGHDWDRRGLSKPYKWDKTPTSNVISLADPDIPQDDTDFRDW